MRKTLLITVLAALFALALGLSQPAFASDSPSNEEPAASLKATEEAFAQTMKDRDHEAFTSFLSEETVFFAGPNELRGKETVAAAWKPFFQGTEAPFSWQPDTAAVLDSGTLGLTSGPILAPDGKRVGTFNSVWRRESDGSWKVVFDRGCPACE